MPFQLSVKGHIRKKNARLPSHLPENFTAGLGTLILEKLKLGCRGFKGPVPPPLWIRVAVIGAIELWREFTIADKTSQILDMWVRS